VLCQRSAGDIEERKATAGSLKPEIHLRSSAVADRHVSLVKAVQSY